MNPLDLMQDIINENIPPNIWIGRPLENWRLLEGTNKGEVGEEFLRRYLSQNAIRVRNGNRTSPYDLAIGPNRIPVEVKAAGLGENGTFQFNHIRMDKPYKWLVVIGICPGEILFASWEKKDVISGIAGSIVNMAESQSVTGKITKMPADLNPIEDLIKWAERI